MKVFDCLMINDEVDMLELRLSILNDVVDYVVIVEAGMTHSGQPKPSPVAAALQTERFSPFADKVIYHYMHTLPGMNAWEREHNQRAAISDALRYVAAPEDIIIVGDCDEIVSPDAVRTMRLYNLTPAFKCELDFYYYDFHHRVQQGWAIGACHWGYERDANKIRTCDFSGAPMVLDPAGWHFSYFGDAAAIWRKVNAFMHADWVDAFHLTPDKVQAALGAGTDLWGRDLTIERVPLADRLPRYVLEHREKYAALGWLEAEAEATWQS